MSPKLPFVQGTVRRPGWRYGRGASGFSLLELVVIIAIIALLMVLALDRLLAMRIEAERVAMETVLGSIRSGLGIKVAETVVKQDMAALQALAGSNPMDRLAEPPRNYLGALDAPDPAALEPGNWYFDRASRVLVYLPKHAGSFSGGLADPPRARFMIELLYQDKNGNGAWDAGAEGLEGVRLQALEPYRWINEYGNVIES